MAARVGRDRPRSSRRVGFARRGCRARRQRLGCSGSRCGGPADVWLAVDGDVGQARVLADTAQQPFQVSGLESGWLRLQLDPHRAVQVDGEGHVHPLSAVGGLDLVQRLAAGGGGRGGGGSRRRRRGVCACAGGCEGVAGRVGGAVVGGVAVGVPKLALDAGAVHLGDGDPGGERGGGGVFGHLLVLGGGAGRLRGPVARHRGRRGGSR